MLTAQVSASSLCLSSHRTPDLNQEGIPSLPTHPSPSADGVQDTAPCSSSSPIKTEALEVEIKVKGNGKPFITPNDIDLQDGNNQKTTTIKYLVLSFTIFPLSFLYCSLKSKHGLYPSPSGCSQNSLFSFSFTSSPSPTLPSIYPLEKSAFSWRPKHGYGEKGNKVSKFNHSFKVPKRPNRNRNKTQNLGFLSKNLSFAVNEEGLCLFLGERSTRAWSGALTISDATEM
nr:hypothetical protein Iba_chr04bCG13240 [Ipomoea batatas]